MSNLFLALLAGLCLWGNYLRFGWRSVLLWLSVWAFAAVLGRSGWPRRRQR
jgi:hypothetical protein